jgi:thiaminase/transcriptional activator TenA
MIFKKMTQAICTLLDDIHQHQFNVELSQGTLPQEKFIFYLIQDAMYLADFSRALSVTAARLPYHSHMQQFIQFALGAVQAERELHSGYINQYLSSGYLAETIEQSPACFMYTNYLLRMASLSSPEEAVASLLPCFFIYNEVGKKMASSLCENHPYYNWIALYASEAFETSVQSAISITNELGYEASEKIRNKMIQSFVKSTQLEWLFWQSAYIQEQWLI